MNRKVTEVAIGIWCKNGELFLSSRPLGKVCEGAWEFPGGKIEPGEAPGEALKREFIEELGLAVKKAEPLGTIEHSYPHAYVRLHVFRVRCVGRPVGKEGQKFGFFVREKLPGKLLPTVGECLALLEEKAA